MKAIAILHPLVPVIRGLEKKIFFVYIVGFKRAFLSISRRRNDSNPRKILPVIVRLPVVMAAPRWILPRKGELNSAHIFLGIVDVVRNDTGIVVEGIVSVGCVNMHKYFGSNH